MDVRILCREGTLSTLQSVMASLKSDWLAPSKQLPTNVWGRLVNHSLGGYFLFNVSEMWESDGSKLIISPSSFSRKGWPSVTKSPSAKTPFRYTTPLPTSVNRTLRPDMGSQVIGIQFVLLNTQRHPRLL